MKLSNLITVLSIAFQGYSAPIREGFVHERIHQPYQEYIRLNAALDTLTRSYKLKQEVCIDDEDFILRVKKYNTKLKDFELRDFYVDKKTFKRYRLGSYFIFNGANADTIDNLEVITSK